MSFVQVENDTRQITPGVNDARLEPPPAMLILTSAGSDLVSPPPLQAWNSLHRSGCRCCKARHDERLHWARELHDRLGQYTAILSLHLSRLLTAGGSEHSHSCYAALVKDVDLLDAELRDILADLSCSPLSKIDLDGSLSMLLARFGASTGLQIAFTCKNLPNNLTGEATQILFRIGQEGLSNVAKHARGARHVSVAVGRTSRYVRIVVEDDGEPPIGDGATRSASGRGIRGMRERLLTVCGTLQARHLPERGFRITARIPLAFVRT